MFTTETRLSPDFKASAQSADESVPIGPLVRSFIGLLEAEDVSWAVLRGSDGLPDHTRYDIDILIDPAKVDQAENLLAQAATSQGWAMIRIINKFHYRCCLLVSPGPQCRFLPVDFFGRCLHRFYPIADDAYALRNRRRTDGGVWVVPPGCGAALALVKELMRHDTFKANSRDEVRRGAVEDADAFLQAVRAHLGPGLGERLLEACQAGEWDRVEALAPKIRRAVWAQRFRQLPAAMAFGWKNLLHHLRPPMSAFVVLLGPDGAGKSTIADLVAQRLYQRPFKICRRFEYNFRFLPELKRFKAVAARLFGRRVPLQSPPKPGTQGSGMNREHGTLRAMLYIAYYSMDLFLGRALVRKLRGQGALLVFARYFHDYYYQRGYGDAPRWFLRLVEWAAPAPDLILYLHRSAEDIYKGKPELDLDEIKRQQAVIKTLVKGRLNALVIDASEGVEATVQHVCEAITRTFLARHGVQNGASPSLPTAVIK